MLDFYTEGVIHIRSAVVHTVLVEYTVLSIVRTECITAHFVCECQFIMLSNGNSHNFVASKFLLGLNVKHLFQKNVPV